MSVLESPLAADQPADKSRFQVRLFSPFPEHFDSVLDAIRDAVLRHLEVAGTDVFRQADLHISVVQSEPGSRFLRCIAPWVAGAAAFKIMVTGTVNDLPIHEVLAARHATGAFGGNSKIMLAACRAECVGQLNLALDRNLGRKEPVFSRTWDRVQEIKWVAAVAVGVAYAVIYAQSGLPHFRLRWMSLVLLIVASFSAAIGVLGLTSMVALVFAPSKFLRTDPRGVKALTRTGVGNIAVMRSMAAVMGLVFSAALLIALALLFAP